MIQEEHLQIGKRIGVGAYAQVFRGFYQGTEVAIKRFNNKEDMSFKAFLTEVDIFLAFRGHPHIISFIGGYKQAQYSYLVTELAKKGNIHDYMKKQGKVVGKKKIQWAIDVACGMAFIHSLEPCILHRDLKADNILISEGGVAKICDFG